MMSKILFSRAHPDAKLPTRGTPDSVGLDLAAVEFVNIPPQEWRIVSTGLSVVFPEDAGGIYGRIAPRAGLAENGIGVGAGVIDRDYRGVLKVVMFNHCADRAFLVSKGDHIAQLILERAVYADAIMADELQ
jgi:dUTP pyrophosphatase